MAPQCLQASEPALSPGAMLWNYSKLQILGKQAARKDTNSTCEMEGLEKTLAPIWDLPLGLVCWGADEPRY